MLDVDLGRAGDDASDPAEGSGVADTGGELVADDDDAQLPGHVGASSQVRPIVTRGVRRGGRDTPRGGYQRSCTAARTSRS